LLINAIRKSKGDKMTRAVLPEEGKIMAFFTVAFKPTLALIPLVILADGGYDP
jgi:hypothetical protein